MTRAGRTPVSFERWRAAAQAGEDADVPDREALAERERAEARARQKAERALAERRQAEADAAALAARMSRLVAPGAPRVAPTEPSVAVGDTIVAPPPAAGPPAVARRATSDLPTRATADGGLATVITIAERSGRSDLSSRLKASQERIRRTGVAVAVVGEFKKGKSNLVNAIVNADICPSDPVYATVVPIEVGYAEELTVVAESVRQGSEPAVAHRLDDIGSVASETGNPENQRGLSRVVVGLPRRLLATGLTLIDTPGIGGLDSAAGALALSGLEAADGVLFATDCSQELTAPELTYLKAARQRCESVLCVMTKVDLYHHADRLVGVNRRHLDTAGMADVPIVAVSSVLHLLALVEGDQELEDESGFPILFDLLHRHIWEPARRRGLAGAGLELASVAAHLAMPMEAEREAASSPEAAARTIARLAEQQDRVRQLRAGAARWQQRLSEGIQDVLGDLDHDLRNRTRVVSRTAEGMADSEHATDELVFEAWLHKAAMEAVIGHYESISTRTSALADDVAQFFVAFDRDAGFHVEATAPADLLGVIQVVRDQNTRPDGVLRRVVTTTQGYSSGMVLASSMFGLVGSGMLAFIPLLTVPVAGYMARRAFSDDRTRRKALRSQELKRLAGRYLDEITFVVQKHSRDTIRRTHRQIRDHFLERTEQLERTLQQAAAAAERVRAQHAAGGIPVPTADPAENTIRHMRTTADRLVATATLAS
ncbi:MAG: dynamin family protein [Ilumatobacteraceae bacterium]